MPEALSCIVDRPDSISLSRVRTFYSCVDIAIPFFDSHTLAFQLVPKASLGVITVQSAEVRYRQKRAGYECWVRLTLNIPTRVREQIARLEGRLRDLLRPRYQQIDQMWMNEGYTFTADMCLTGDHPCRLLNASGCPIAPPASWTTAAVVPVVALRCLCVHGAGAFAEYELTALVVAGDHGVLPDPSVIV
jgi:hypothetical protein